MVSRQNVRPLDICPGFLGVLQMSQGIRSPEITALSATQVQTASQTIHFWVTARDSICFIYLAFLWVLCFFKQADFSEDWLDPKDKTDRFASFCGAEGTAQFTAIQSQWVGRQQAPAQRSVCRREVLLTVTARFQPTLCTFGSTQNLIILVYVLI